MLFADMRQAKVPAVHTDSSPVYKRVAASTNVQANGSEDSTKICLTLKWKRDPHGGARRGCPLLQLPLLEGVMGLCAAFKGSWVVGVVHMVLLPWLHVIGLVRILVCGRPCTICHVVMVQALKVYCTLSQDLLEYNIILVLRCNTSAATAGNTQYGTY